MKSDESISIAERLAAKKRKRTPPAVSHTAVKPELLPPAAPRMTMTVEEMGKELGVSRVTAYELAQQPGFPSFSIGRRVLVSRDGLLKWIEKQCSAKIPEGN